MRRVRYHWFVFLAGSWGGSQKRLVVDPTTRKEWCRRRDVASPPSLNRVQICLVLPVLTNPAFRVRLRL